MVAWAYELDRGASSQWEGIAESLPYFLAKRTEGAGDLV